MRIAGAVELREDVPLKPSGGGVGGARLCGGGPRVISGAFAALTLAVTVALLTQIYAGDYEVRARRMHCDVRVGDLQLL